MKLSKQTLTKIGLVAITLCLLLPSSLPARADQYDDQINALKRQVAQQQQEANSLHAKANDYRSKVSELQAQIGAVQSQIMLNQARYDKLSSDIDQAEVDLAKQKSIFDENIRSIYKEGELNSIEILASSDSFSDFVNKQEYSQKVKDKVESALVKIKGLKSQLDKQKQEVASVLQDQKSQQQSLAAIKAENDQLLALAQESAGAADSKVQQSNAQIASLKSQQSAALAARFGGSVSGGGACGGGYPAIWCNAPQDSRVDSWGMYNRECVSYTAFKVDDSGRNMPYWGGRGNAWQWAFSGYKDGIGRYYSSPGNGRIWHNANAQSAGIPVDGNPRRGDVAIALTGEGYWGHAMYVEDVLGGGQIRVSQYNYGNRGEYSTMTISSAGIRFIHF